jgi:selenocysteine lyase/cysteine desulfurase
MRLDPALEAMQQALREASISCSSRGGRVWVSLALYNDEGDIDALEAAVK